MAGVNFSSKIMQSALLLINEFSNSSYCHSAEKYAQNIAFKIKHQDEKKVSYEDVTY